MERILFVTGRLAEPSLRRVLGTLSAKAGFDYEVAVLGISVAALMHVGWVQRKLTITGEFDRVILPGRCRGDLQELSVKFAVPFERGPQELFDLPEHFGRESQPRADLNEFDIEILAEINHAPLLSDAEILYMADAFRDSGADLIDLGCIPGERWQDAGRVTKLLIEAGHRISIDSFDRWEVEAAVDAGAELVLSCNSQNREWAAGIDAEFVVIPDEPSDFASLQQSVEFLSERDCRFRIDPVLEPIGFGFAASLDRYSAARRRWPQTEILMGIGNLTELTEADSGGINMLLAGICQELGIKSVLTTQVINWAQSAVREFDLARRVSFHSIRHKVLPKHLDSQLVMLRDPRLQRQQPAEIDELAARITDPNFRIAIAGEEIHVFNRDGHWHGRDPYELYDRIIEDTDAPEGSHAFYLGYEMCKAVTALTLGKQYTQDDALNWGFLTETEVSAHDRRAKPQAKRQTEPDK